LQYTKPALGYAQQADLVLGRGLIADRQQLIGRLEAVGYYRLCAYWHPFKLPGNTFVPGTTFDEVWRRYTFDRQLRLLVMDAIERVEVSVRSTLVTTLTLSSGPFAHLDIRRFPDASPDQHRRFLADLRESAQRSNEVFVDHFRATYDEYPDLPLWTAAEIMTFGAMFTLFKMSGKHVQTGIAARYSVPARVMLNWLLTINYVRNLCAHHSRLWNRELAIRPMIPFAKNDPRWHAAGLVDNRRVFAVLSLLRVLLQHVAPTSSWRQRVIALIDGNPAIPSLPMGFPADWRTHPLWRQ